MKPSRITILAILVLLASLFAVPEARATTTCTTTMTDLNFGTIDASGYADMTATLEYRCETHNVLAFGAPSATVRLCFAIGAGSQPGSTVASRLMRNAQSDSLQFQLYRNSARTQVWGNSTGTNTVDVLLSYPLDSFIGIGATGSGQGTTTLHGRVPAQAVTAAGTFNASFDADTSATYRYRETILVGTPSSCTSGGTGGTTARFAFSASAVVPHRCSISTATDLSFGTVPGLIDSPKDQTSSVSLSCTNRTPWNLALDNGQNAAGNIRRMRLGTSGNYVAYELYRNPGRTQRWGATAGSDTVTGTGAGTTQTETVYGRVPAGQAVPVGTYRDVVTVTVTY